MPIPGNSHILTHNPSLNPFWETLVNPLSSIAGQGLLLWRRWGSVFQVLVLFKLPLLQRGEPDSTADTECVSVVESTCASTQTVAKHSGEGETNWLSGNCSLLRAGWHWEETSVTHQCLLCLWGGLMGGFYHVQAGCWLPAAERWRADCTGAAAGCWRGEGSASWDAATAEAEGHISATFPHKPQTPV